MPKDPNKLTSHEKKLAAKFILENPKIVSAEIEGAVPAMTNYFLVKGISIGSVNGDARAVKAYDKVAGFGSATLSGVFSIFSVKEKKLKEYAKIQNIKDGLNSAARFSKK